MTATLTLSELLDRISQEEDVSLGLVVYVIKQGSGTLKYLVIDEIEFPRSKPTRGNYKVTNLYVDASTKKLVVEYDDNSTS